MILGDSELTYLIPIRWITDDQDIDTLGSGLPVTFAVESWGY